VHKVKKIKNNSTFGRRLRKVRKNMGLNQTEFAKKLGFSANTIISRFERNKSLPTVETLLVLAKNPDVDLHWLITGQPAPGNKRLEKIYYTAVGKLAKYIAKGLKDLLQLRDIRLSELADLEREQKKGQEVDERFAQDLAFEIHQIQTELAEFIKDQPWIEQSLKTFDSYNQH